MAISQAISRHVRTLRVLRIQSPLAWTLDDTIGPPTYSDKVFLHRILNMLPEMCRAKEIA